MKKVTAFLGAIVICSIAFAQAPNKFSYQAVLRNPLNQILSNKAVGIKISILKGANKDSVVYAETHAANTNINGLVSLEIGSGNVIAGSMTALNWGKGIFHIKTETDPNGGSNYSIAGTSQLVSVPYALHAQTASTVSNLSLSLDQLTDVNTSSPQTGQVLAWNGTSWNPEDMKGSNWTLSNGNIYRNAGNVGINSINPEYPLTINWNGQTGPENATRAIFVNVTAKNTTGSFLNQGVYSVLNTNNASGRSINGLVTGVNSGIGVVGEATTTKAGTGVAGYSISTSGDNSQKSGVIGLARGAWDNSSTGNGDHYGVMGLSQGGATSNNNSGVYGESNGASVSNAGGQFVSFGSGIRNYGASGVSGGSGTLNIGLIGIGNSSKGDLNTGVYGTVLTDKSTSNFGVYGANEVADGTKDYNTGIYGYAGGNAKENYAIDGTSNSSKGISYGTTGWAFGKGSANYAMYAMVGGDALTKYAAFFDGNVTVTGTFSNPSDKKLKTNITSLAPVSSKLLALNVYNYEYVKNSINLPEGAQFGFLAQDVEALFPNLVKEELAPLHKMESYTGEDGKEYFKKVKIGEERFKSVNYIGLIPVLTKTIQEQQTKINQLEERLKILEERMNQSAK